MVKLFKRIIIYIIKESGGVLKKIFYNFAIALPLMAIWVILTENIEILNIIIGAFVCTFAINFSCKALDIDFAKTFYLPPFKLIKYAFYLLLAVYKSGIKATVSIITGNIKPNIIKTKIHKDIKDKYLQNIIGSSITLTPGTITLENTNGSVTVLCLHDLQGESPCESFEKQVLLMQKQKKEN